MLEQNSQRNFLFNASTGNTFWNGPKQERCSFLEDEQGEQISVWVFKYPFVEELIKSQPLGCEKTGVWITGKLLGYSDYEIARFLQTSGCYGSPLG